MSTVTPNFSFEKPDVGGDTDVWGGMLNGNWDIVDAELVKSFNKDASGQEDNEAPVLRLGGFLFALSGAAPALPGDPETRTLIITVNGVVVFRLDPDTAGLRVLDIVADDPV